MSVLLRSERKLFFLTWLFVALVTRTGPTSAHEWARLGTVESLVERWSYQLDESKFHGTRDKVFSRGHFYSHQPPLLATIESPVYWSLHLVGLRFSNNAPFDPAYYLFVVLTNGLALALTVVVLARSFALASLTVQASRLYALVLTMGTWLLPYGIVTNNHGVAGLLIAVLAYHLLRLSLHGPTIACCRWLGATLGLLVAVEVLPAVSFVPLTAGYLWSRGDLSDAAWRHAAVAFAIPLVVHAAINVPIVGDVLPAGFHFELFAYPGSTFDQRTLSGSLKFDSTSAWLDYAWHALVAGKGYFTFAPVLALGLAVGAAGWCWWRRARGAQVVLLGGTLTSLVAALLTTNNFGGVAVGFRHATYLAPAMLVLLIPVLSSQRLAGRIAARRVIVFGVGSALGLLLYAVPQPWSSLQWPPGPPSRDWRVYLPLLDGLSRWLLPFS
jgi:hypothetical protein